MLSSHPRFSWLLLHSLSVPISDLLPFNLLFFSFLLFFKFFFLSSIGRIPKAVVPTALIFFYGFDIGTTMTRAKEVVRLFQMASTVTLKARSNILTPPTPCFHELVLSRNSQKLSRGTLNNKREFDLVI